MTNAQDLGPAAKLDGKVFTFTRDLSVTFPGRNRRPGVHFICVRVNEYTVTAWDTQRQRWESLMNESWLVDLTRVIGTFASAVDEYRDDCTACLNDWHFCKACDDVVGHDHIHGEE